MPLKDITDKIIADARAEAAAILKESGREEDKRRREMDSRIAAAVAAAEKKHADKIAQTLEQGEFRSRLLKKNALLKIKQELLGAAYEEAKKRLAGLGDAEFTELCRRMLEGSPHMEGAVVKTTKARMPAVKKALAAAGLDYRLSDEALAAGTDGFVIVSPNVEIDYRIDNFIAAQRQEFEAEAAKIIFS